jgi:hypothetical protein
LANHWAEQQRQTGVESNALAGWLGSRVAEPIAQVSYETAFFWPILPKSGVFLL